MSGSDIGIEIFLVVGIFDVDFECFGIAINPLGDLIDIVFGDMLVLLLHVVLHGFGCEVVLLDFLLDLFLGFILLADDVLFGCNREAFFVEVGDAVVDPAVPVHVVGVVELDGADLESDD